jgi:hypothetical protein
MSDNSSWWLLKGDGVFNHFHPCASRAADILEETEVRKFFCILASYFHLLSLQHLCPLFFTPGLSTFLSKHFSVVAHLDILKRHKKQDTQMYWEWPMKGFYPKDESEVSRYFRQKTAFPFVLPDGIFITPCQSALSATSSSLFYLRPSFQWLWYNYIELESFYFIIFAI